MTFRLESERMFVSVLAAIVVHGVLLIGVHRLFDLSYEDFAQPLTVKLLNPEVQEAIGQEDLRSVVQAVPKQQEPTASSETPNKLSQANVTKLPELESKPSPERVTQEMLARVKTQPRAVAAIEDASVRDSSTWMPALRQSVEAAPVRGRGGLSALKAEGRPSQSGAELGELISFPDQLVRVSSAAEYLGQRMPAATFKDGLTLPIDESVYAKSTASLTPDVHAAQSIRPDDLVPVVRDLGFLGQDQEGFEPVSPVRMSGTPTPRKAGIFGSEKIGKEPASSFLADPTPGMAKAGPVDATVYGGAVLMPGETVSIGSRIRDLDRSLSAGGHDSTSSPGRDVGSSSYVDGSAGPTGSDLQLPKGWSVLGSLGLRPLVNVVRPALSDRYPDEIVDTTVVAHIRVEPEGWVRVVKFERDSGSTRINNQITETLRQWRYQPVQGEDPVYGVVTIQIRIRSS